MATKKPAPRHKTKETNVIIDGETGMIVREAPIERRLQAGDIILPAFNSAQMNILINRTPAWAVKTRPGAGGQNLKYVSHGYVSDQLNKAFGFDWDLVIDPIENGKLFTMQVFEKRDAKNNVVKTENHICVAGHIVVRVKGKTGTHEIVKYGFGSQIWRDSMEFGDALKAARSDMLKTCAFQLGIALDLYYNETNEEAAWNKKNAAQEFASKVKSNVPEQPMFLITRAIQDYGIEGDTLDEILGITFDQLMELNPKECVEAWEKVVKYAKSNK